MPPSSRSIVWRQPGPIDWPTMRCIGSSPRAHSPYGVKSMEAAIAWIFMRSSTVTRMIMPCTGVPGVMGPRSIISKG